MRFPLEPHFLRAEHDQRLPIARIALGALLQLAFTCASDEQFAVELVHHQLEGKVG